MKTIGIIKYITTEQRGTTHISEFRRMSSVSMISTWVTTIIAQEGYNLLSLKEIVVKKCRFMEDCLHFVIVGHEPKLFVFKCLSQKQSCREHEIGQFCHQD